DRADDGRRRRSRRDHGEVRGGRQPVLLDGAPLGRRDHRPARHPPRARARPRGGAERADPRDHVRRLPDVTPGASRRRAPRGARSVPASTIEPPSPTRRSTVPRKIPHPSPAMVVACAALVVALGGTSIAAVQVLVPRNSVGSAQVINRSLLPIDFRTPPKGPV